MSGLPRGLWVGPTVLLALLAFAANVRGQPVVSPGQEATDQLFVLVLIPAIGIGILVMALLTYAVIKFRTRKGQAQAPMSPKTHDRRLEALWTVIPAIILLVVGLATFQTLRVTDAIPANPDVVVEVTGFQWFWEFNVTEANGSYVQTNGEFTVKEGQVVRLVVTASGPAIHSLWIPAFKLKVDAVPGQENVYWFQPLQPGDYDIYCAEFCGVGHYTMLATLHVTA